MYLATFDVKDENEDTKYWYIPEDQEEAFLKEGIKLIKELRWKLREKFMDILVGVAVKQLYSEGKYGIQKITRAEAKENQAKLWVDLPAYFIEAAFNKSIKTANGWLITGDDEK